MQKSSENACIYGKRVVSLQCGSKDRTARATSQPLLKWLKNFTIMISFIISAIQTIIYIAIVGFLCLMLIGQQIHDVKILFGKEKTEN